HEHNEVSLSFYNESRFKFLHHPYVISMINVRDRDTICYQREVKLGSTILFELAKCDFYDIYSLEEFRKDQTLIRTYFHQLIEGLEYLHKNGIAHTDLKLENLLL